MSLFHWPEIAVHEVDEATFSEDAAASVPDLRRYARCDYCGERCRRQGNYGVQCNGAECKRRRAERRAENAKKWSR